MTKQKLRALIAVGAVVLIAVAVMVVKVVLQSVSENGKSPESSWSIPVTYAPKGNIVPEFPKNLVLDPGAVVTQSYAINYSSSTNQYTVQWNSSSSIKTLFNAYKTYFATNGWAITNSSTQMTSVRAIAASGDPGKISAVIMTGGNGSQVILTYIPKQ